MKITQLIPKSELPNVAEWVKTNGGGWREYLQSTTLSTYTPQGEKNKSEETKNGNPK